MPSTLWLHRPGTIAPRFLGRFRKDTRGVASIEMAFIFPVMLLICFGLIDVGNLLSASRRVTLTASTLGDLVTQAPGTITKADLDGFFEAASPIMDPFPASEISLEVFGFTKDGETVKLSWSHKNAAASCGAAPGISDQMKALMSEGNDVVVARTCYNWAPITGQIFGADPIKVEDELTLRPRQSATLTCKCT